VSDSDSDASVRRGLRARPGVVAAVVLLGCVAAFVLLAVKPGAGGSRARCPSELGSEVAMVPASELGPLRERVARVLPGRIGRLYEEGTIVARNAWSDNEPLAPGLSPIAPRPAGYEMRWWSPSGDDIVADVWQFADAAGAGVFIQRALSTRCRRAAAQVPLSHPLQAGNLTWVNPDAVAEADVFLQRGALVYRVADVPRGASDAPLPARRLARALYTIDALVCLIPHAGCGLPDNAAPV
jgi:hypothetical protein